MNYAKVVTTFKSGNNMRKVRIHTIKLGDMAFKMKDDDEIVRYCRTTAAKRGWFTAYASYRPIITTVELPNGTADTVEYKS